MANFSQRAKSGVAEFTRIPSATGTALKFCDFSYRRRAGFTLVELLVVIAIIGILVALLLPAIQAAREAARRAQCQSQIKNVALAVLNYESSKGQLPNGMNVDTTNPNWTTTIHTPSVYRRNWIIDILPYLEEQALYDSFDFTKAINDNTAPLTSNKNYNARGQIIPVLLCPSDPNSQILYQGAVTTHGTNWGRTNYAANVGRGFIYWGQYNAAKEYLPWKDSCQRGVMGPHLSVKLKQITDGTSKTFMVGELRTGLTEKDARGVWAMGHAGASLLAMYGAGGDDNGPNACYPFADDVYSDVCSRPAAKLECMDCDPGYFAQATMRSVHLGGVHAAMCDASVQFIDDNIETSGVPGNCCSVWDWMITSADGGVGGPYNGVPAGQPRCL